MKNAAIAVLIGGGMLAFELVFVLIALAIKPAFLYDWWHRTGLAEGIVHLAALPIIAAVAWLLRVKR